MKKRIIYIGIGLWLVTMIYAAYQYNIATHTVNIIENLGAQYYESAAWHDITSGSMGTYDLSPGESVMLQMRLTNIADGGVIAGIVKTEPPIDISYQWQCTISGLEWEKNDNDFYIRLPSGGVWQEFGLNMTVGAEAQPQVGLTLNYTIQRTNDIGNYENVCP